MPKRYYKQRGLEQELQETDCFRFGWRYLNLQSQIRIGDMLKFNKDQICRVVDYRPAPKWELNDAHYQLLYHNAVPGFLIVRYLDYYMEESKELKVRSLTPLSKYRKRFCLVATIDRPPEDQKVRFFAD